jgi:acetyltransferase-like isoleucine patch superfamily enzyme
MAFYRAEVSLSGLWLAMRFVYCWLYRFRFERVGSFFIRGSFRIRGAWDISIGTLRAGNRISMEAVEFYGSQSFSPKISIGKGVCFSNDIHIGCTNRVTLGDGVLPGSHVYFTDHDQGIYAGDEPPSAPESNPSKRPLTATGTVTLEDNVHVGEYVTILKNVRIGAGSIVGAHSNVTRSIPPYTIAAGNPVRPLKRYCQTSRMWVKLDAAE